MSEQHNDWQPRDPFSAGSVVLGPEALADNAAQAADAFALASLDPVAPLGDGSTTFERLVAIRLFELERSRSLIDAELARLRGIQTRRTC